MSIKSLSDADKEHLMQLAVLLVLSDKPLLWDGKTADKITSRTDTKALSICVGKRERKLIAKLKAVAEITNCASSTRSWKTKLIHPIVTPFGVIEIPIPFSGGTTTETVIVPDVSERLIEVLKSIPIAKAEEPENRVKAALTVLKELLEHRKTAIRMNPEPEPPPEQILHELMRVALCDSHISDIQLALLKEYQHHYQLEEAAFDDLLERAKAQNQEMSLVSSALDEEDLPADADRLIPQSLDELSAAMGESAIDEARKELVQALNELSALSDEETVAA